MGGQRSALRRAWRMATMSAGVLGSYAGYLTQRAFLGDEKRGQKLRATHVKAGRRITDELAGLRGPAMKLGQALSLQTGVVPDEIIQQLSTLQMHAPGMHPSLVRAQFKTSMGAPPEEVFRWFDPEPFAAASLGQVHQAVTRDGRKVAVKIQYPGIRDAVANDFKWVRSVTAAAQFAKYIPKSALDETEQQIVAETDYIREADNIDFFRQGLRPLSYVTVPEVYREYSSDKVLTMSLVNGDHLEAYLAKRPSQQERDKLGSHLLELFCFQLFRVEAFHADPHWGNYFFGPNGTVGLVDFGCVKYLTPSFVDSLRASFLYPGDRSSAAFRHLLRERWTLEHMKLKPAAEESLVRFAEGFYRRVYPPEREKDNTPFDFAAKDFMREFMRESVKLFRAKGTLPEHVFFVRAETGLHQTLHSLRARVLTSKIVRQFLPSRR